MKKPKAELPFFFNAQTAPEELLRRKANEPKSGSDVVSTRIVIEGGTMVEEIRQRDGSTATLTYLP